MKIEHLTLGGNSVMKDAEDSVHTETLEILRKNGFQINSSHESKTLPVSGTRFQIKITMENGIIMFNVEIADQIGFLNICSTQEATKVEAMKHVNNMHESLKSNGFGLGKPKQPKHGAFIYTIPVNPFVAQTWTKDELAMVADLEFCIFYALYLSLDMNY